MGSEGQKRRWPSWAVPAGALLIAALVWANFHPDFRADPREVSAAMRAELARTGFKATHGVRSARFAQHQSQEGFDWHAVADQQIAAIDAVLTEKRSKIHRRESELAVLAETSGLYAGPIPVLRYARDTPPLIGDLLPYQFWNSSRLSEFAVETNDNFPHTAGGTLVARFAYDNHYGDGQPGPAERGRLRCAVAELKDAGALGTRLSGRAARLECREAYDTGEQAHYTHWYLLESGWSIPIEGEYPVTFAGARPMRRWRNELTAFDEAAAN